MPGGGERAAAPSVSSAAALPQETEARASLPQGSCPGLTALSLRPTMPLFLPSPDTNSKMQEVEDGVAPQDAGVEESGSCDPGGAGLAGEDENSSRDRRPFLTDTVNEVSKLSNKTGLNHNSHLEEVVLPPSSPEGKVEETVHNDFWDHLKEQLSATPPDFSCALDLLNEIKEILLSLLLPRQNRLRSEIEAALDADFLKQEAEHGTLDVSSLSKYILDMMTLLCAPVRDEAVQTLEDMVDPVGLLRGIFQILGLMKMDMVNYTIQSLQPQLEEHSIQYERAKFQEQLDQHPSLLDHTTKWLAQAAADLTTPPTCPDNADSSGVAGPSPNEAASNPEPLSPVVVLSQGFLNLLLWDPENEEFPETLQMDRTQLQELEAELQQLTILASVLLVAGSFSGSVLCGSPQLVDKLKRLTKALMEEFSPRLEDAMQILSEQVSQEIHQSLKNMGLAALSSDNTASLKRQLQNIAEKENCVRSVIDQRIHLFLKCCLLLGVPRSLLDLPGGLALIETELAELGQKFINLTHHNQQVFGSYYTEILKTLTSPSQALKTQVESL
ncbi:T-complex protein 11 homolog isoform X2 [Fukomys damarensis]|uniref:T-complex protein 11 like protein n=1 Tax=Fukomys damarensis TaxID=885580 RepID=A0A091CWT8_FUKDA|nr:T-complex protein 11 homolog isoform X2 [Fukomys damarensis]KFO23147.1 T-complex protein 11 like protein [Fukomys damarensis]